MSIKKFFILCSVMSVLFFLDGNLVYATENEGVSFEPPRVRIQGEEEIQTRGLERPSKDTIYTNNQYEPLAGSSSNAYLYSNKCFYGVYQITFTVTNNSASDLKVVLYCYTDSPFNEFGYSEVQSFNVSANSTKTLYFRNLDEKTYYFLSFKAPSDFSGRAIGFQQ